MRPPPPSVNTEGTEFRVLCTGGVILNPVPNDITKKTLTIVMDTNVIFYTNSAYVTKSVCYAQALAIDMILGCQAVGS